MYRIPRIKIAVSIKNHTHPSRVRYHYIERGINTALEYEANVLTAYKDQLYPFLFIES